jgi:hypothetical protein
MDAVTILRWVATVLLAVFVVVSIAQGEVTFGGPRTSIKRREKPLAFWAVIGLGAVLIVSNLTGFP